MKYNFSIAKLFYFYLFIVLIIFDSITGFLVVNKVISSAGIGSPSQIGRFLLTIFSVFILYKYKVKIPVISTVFIYLVSVELVLGFFHNNTYGFQYGLVNAYKIIYLAILCSVIPLFIKRRCDINTFFYFIKVNLIIVSSLIYFSIFTGLGNSTYQTESFGTKSFFSSGNGLGIYLGVLSIVIFCASKYNMADVSKFSLLYIMFSIPLVGTKTALILFFLNFVLLVYYSQFRKLFFFLLSLCVFLAAPKLIDLFNVIFEVIIYRFNKSESLLLYLGSGRIEYVIDALDVFLSQPSAWWRLFIGGGAFTSFQSLYIAKSFDTLETDLFDLLFMYGFLGLICYLSFLAYIVVRLSKFRLFLIPSLLLFFHSIIAGHVLFNGMSSLVIVVLFVVSSSPRLAE